MLRPIRCFVVLLFCCAFTGQVLAQANTTEAAEQAALNYAVPAAKGQQLLPTDLMGVVVDYAYTDERRGVTYVYLQQRLGEVPIEGASATAVVMGEQVFNFTHRFVDSLAFRVVSSSVRLDDEVAVRTAAERVGQTLTTSLRPDTKQSAFAKTPNPRVRTYAAPDFVSDDIQVADRYLLGEDGKLRRALTVSLSLKQGDYYSISVDASSGEVLEVLNLTIHCSFDHDFLAPRHTGACDPLAQPRPPFAPSATVASVPDGSSYRVFPWPAESPSHGEYLLVSSPADSIASPFGWHDTDGVDGPEFTITRGNNNHAYVDGENRSTPSTDEPDGGPTLTFDFPYDPEIDPREQTDVTTTNLFYGVNQLHDFAYHYGFDEPAGNFQQTNYSGLGLGNDYVLAQSQDGSLRQTQGENPVVVDSFLNNANFATPTDGGSGRMQMYLWNTTVAGQLLQATAPASVLNKTYGAVQSVTGWGDGASIDDETLVTAGVADARDNVPNQAFTDACEDLINGNELAGRIALIDRGGCEFGAKALRAQKAGAVAVIICNFEDNVAGMGPGADGQEVTIPTMMLTSSGCATLRSDANRLAELQLTIRLPADVEQGPTYVSGSFDNGIVAHEFGHGISNRLTAGPGVNNCLQNAEQMGEGWSDFFTLVTSATQGDEGATPRGIGTYAQRQETNGPGIRPFPYSSDMATNPVTYGDVADGSTFSQPHGIGSIWASMVWDMYWDMVEVHGYDDDLFYGNGGNNKAIELVMMGLKLQPCNPGFVDGRDAILAADRVLSQQIDGSYGRSNELLIWNTFARRGLGFFADQGDPDDRADGTEDFSLPPALANRAYLTKTATSEIEAGGDVIVALTVANWLDDDAATAVLTDELPDGAELVASSVTQPYTLDGNMIRFEFENLTEGDSVEVTYTYVSPEIASELTFEDRIDEKGDEGEYDSENFQENAEEFWAVTDDGGFDDDFAWEVSLLSAGSQPYFQQFTTSAQLIDLARPVFTFQHRYGITGGLEGAFVEVYTESTGRWTALRSDQFLRNGYPSIISYGVFAIPFLDGFAGRQPEWEQVFVDLSDFAGEQVSMRWRFGRDDGAGGDGEEFGWQVDNLQLVDMVAYNSAAVLTINDATYSAEAPNIGTYVRPGELSINTKDAEESFSQLNIFPNPTSSTLTLEWGAAESLEAGIVTLHDLTGRATLQRAVPAGQGRMQLDVSGLGKGVYAARVQRGNKAAVVRVAVN